MTDTLDPVAHALALQCPVCKMVPGHYCDAQGFRGIVIHAERIALANRRVSLSHEELGELLINNAIIPIGQQP